ncbi:MAG TPA: hypothetical protein VMF07_10500 [Solirubrobacteraceae bacterium]|nr:hypothetical protein [Solirubrobacteraceae bacterium]
MTSDGPEPIDTELLLNCIPDEASEGITREAIRDLYAQRQPSFSAQDFDAALKGLVGVQVRTTTKRSWGVNVPLYRHA